MKRIVPRKRFGQHFLTDSVVLDSIVSAFAPQRTDRVLEIGPGTGVLTERLLNHLDHLVAVELDRDLASHLEHRFADHSLSILQQDILKTAIRSPHVLGKSTKLRIIGNLPYNIATPLLFHLFESLDIIHDMLFMMQKEVALRLVATPGNRNYGRLSVMAWLKLDCELLFDVDAKCFSPPPKVQSSVIHMHPREPHIQPKKPERLELLVKTAFSQRRKTLRNSLGNSITPRQFTDAGIDDSLRPENLHPLDFLRLADLEIEN